LSAYLALPRVANGKGGCPFGTAVANSINSTLESVESVSKSPTLQEYDGVIPAVAKRRNIASIRFGGSIAPPSSMGMQAPMR
jgi:hypothetical protein